LISPTLGNPGGSLEATRRSFNKDFLLALAADFKQHGASAIAKVRKQQPAAYMKICALLAIDYDPVSAGHGTRPAPTLLAFRAIAASHISELFWSLEEPSFAALPFFVRC
jgi:hypothetical protein